MRSQRSDGRVLLRIRIVIGCGNDDDPEPAAILATRRQHRCRQCIALHVAQREEKRHLSLYMGLEADVALNRVGSLRTPGLDCLLPLAAKIFLDRMAHEARLMHRFTFRLDTEPGLTVRCVANILHFARPAIPAILGRWACKTNMRFASVYSAARSYNRKFSCKTARLLLDRRWSGSDLMMLHKAVRYAQTSKSVHRNCRFGHWRTSRSVRIVSASDPQAELRRAA